MPKHQIKVFLISLVFQFVISSLLYLGIKPPQFQIPFMQKQLALAAPQIQQLDPLDNLKPLLEKKTNSYLLDKDLSIIPEAKAASADIEILKAYGVVEFDTGRILLDKNLSEKLPIASLTKLMTAVVALDLASSDEIITVNFQGTTPEPSKLFLKVGEEYSLKELVNFILISSANDAAEVIKEGINQKYEAKVFIEAMNYKAQSLGLKNTHFTNPQGFDSKAHFSSIEDLAILSHYALVNYPLIAEVVKKPFADLREIPGDNRLYLNNWNGLLGVYPGILGLKTGNTDQAMHTNIVLSEREGKKVLAILLGASTILDRDLYSVQLLNSGFEKLDLEPIEITEASLKEKYTSWKRFD
jgi:serine-type D-Ala-D-Ala carboxypeptidase (penicillin-binding protein 5/6)